VARRATPTCPLHLRLLAHLLDRELVSAAFQPVAEFGEFAAAGHLAGEFFEGSPAWISVLTNAARRSRSRPCAADRHLQIRQLSCRAGRHFLLSGFPGPSGYEEPALVSQIDGSADPGFTVS
jgi:hypothetical protein